MNNTKQNIFNNKEAGLWLKCHRLSQENIALRAENNDLIRALKSINSRNSKKISGQYVVLDFKEGKFIEPKVIEADSCEEALMPENEIYIGNVVIPIPAFEEFKDL